MRSGSYSHSSIRSLGEGHNSVYRDHYYQQPGSSFVQQQNLPAYQEVVQQISYQHRPTPRTGGSGTIFSRTPSTQMYRQVVNRQQHSKTEYYDQYGRRLEVDFQQPQEFYYEETS